MKKILLLGAGRSSVYLIDYLLENSKGKWELSIGDVSLEAAQAKLGNRPYGKAMALDVTDAPALSQAIAGSDLVISLLPPALHILAAHVCLAHHKHLVTASYVSPEIKALDQEAKAKGLLFLNECGLDPGIDHMSAMKVMDEIRKHGGVLTEFKSYCGGLVAKEDIDNPFGYKFSWNPRNVILAGQATASFLWKGKTKFIPYHRIFTDIETIGIFGGEQFDAYANRDSLSYIQTYGIPEVKTMLRGTLRYPGFCKLWNFIVQAGLTDAKFYPDPKVRTYLELMDSLRPNHGRFLEQLTVEEELELQNLVESTGLFEAKALSPIGGSVADMLQSLLEKSWAMQAKDKDRVVMQHLFGYELDGQHHVLTSTLDINGQDSLHTAMAKTVGLPLAMASKLVLEDRIQERGVCIPLTKDFYLPILSELEEHGIRFYESGVVG